jgi:trimeric autotransporter adhesin
MSINTNYTDPSVATMLATRGSTADAANATAPKGAGPLSNIQGVLQQLSDILNSLGAATPAAAQRSPVMAQQAPGANGVAGLPQPLQQLVNAALAFAAQAQPKTASPLGTNAPAATATGVSAPTTMAGAQPAAAAAAPAAASAAPQTAATPMTQPNAPVQARGDVGRGQGDAQAPETSKQPASGTLQAAQKPAAEGSLGQPLASGVLGAAQKPAAETSSELKGPVSQAMGTIKQAVAQATESAERAMQKAPPMSDDRATRILADNFPDIQSDNGIKLSDLKQIAKGEKVNGMKEPPSPLLQQAAKTFADNPKAFGEAETMAQKATGDKNAKPDGALGLEDLSYNLNRSKTLGAGEKETLQTLDAHKGKLFDKDGMMDVSVLKSVADTGKLPDGKTAPAELKAAAERVTSSPWLMAKLDTSDATSQGKWDARADGKVSDKDLAAALKQAGDVSVDQAQGLRGGAKPSNESKLDTVGVDGVAQAAKDAFGDKAKAVLEAAAKSENGEKLDDKLKQSVENVVKTATETFGDAKTAAQYLSAAAKKL